MTIKKLKIIEVSESAFSVKGHGVHTAYVETVRALRRVEGVEVLENSFERADARHIHTLGVYGLAQLLFGSGKKIVTAHVVPASFVGSIALAKYWLPAARLYLKFFYRRADLVLAVSGMVAEVLKDDLGVSPDKIKVFYNSIDMSQYAPSESRREAARSELEIPEADLVVVGNGQIQPRKRLDTFVAMAKAHPDVKFIWMGGIPFKRLGADYASMQKLVDNIPENMTITGVIDLAEVAKYYQAADIFCLPAEQENHPMSVLEAAGAELPIVLRDIPEYDDTFEQNALRCNTDEEFAAAIEELKDPAARNQWTQKSKLIRNRFDSTLSAQRLVSIINDML